MTAVLEEVHEDAPELSGGVENLLPPVQQRTIAPQRRYLTSPTPWRAKDVGRAGALGTLGVLGLGACVYGASGEVSLRDQIGWILASLLCTALVVIAGAMWLITSFREVRRGMRELAADKRQVFGLTHETTVPVIEDILPADLDLEGFVTAAGMTRYHRDQCLLVSGKRTIPATPDLLPCGVCVDA